MLLSITLTYQVVLCARERTNEQGYAPHFYSFLLLESMALHKDSFGSKRASKHGLLRLRSRIVPAKISFADNEGRSTIVVVLLECVQDRSMLKRDLGDEKFWSGQAVGALSVIRGTTSEELPI